MRERCGVGSTTYPEGLGNTGLEDLSQVGETFIMGSPLQLEQHPIHEAL